jgi:hypothetical protein
MLWNLDQRLCQVSGFKPERTGHALKGNAAVGIDEIETVGPTCVVFLNLILHGVDQGGHANVKFADAGRGNLLAVGNGGGVLKDDAFLDVALRLPEVAGMRLIDVNDEESHVVSVLLVEPVERGNLPAKRRSSIAAEDEYDGLFAAKRREGDGTGVVEQWKREVGRLVADLQMAAAGLLPHGFEREEEKRHWANVFHDARKFVGGLVHGVVEEAEDGQVNNG